MCLKTKWPASVAELRAYAQEFHNSRSDADFSVLQNENSIQPY